MNKSTINKLLNKLADITVMDASMNAQYFFDSYAIDVNCPPVDEIELRYWEKCIRTMQGKPTSNYSAVAIDNCDKKTCVPKRFREMPTPALVEENRPLNAIAVAINCGCNVNIANSRMRRVKANCGGVLVEKHLASQEAYKEFIASCKHKRITKYVDLETRVEYSICELRIMFPDMSTSTLSKHVLFLTRRNMFTINAMKNRIERTKQFKALLNK
jgi:hypothetical protein